MPTLTKAAPSTRWNLVISDETNIAVRSFLAQRGGKKGDLSLFVEEAVRWRVFDQTLAKAREGFADVATKDVQSLLDEALVQVRKDGLSNGTYDAFKPAKKAAATPVGKVLRKVPAKARVR